MESLEKVILEVLEKNNPDNVRELIQLVQKQVDASSDVIEQSVKSLHKKGLVSLEEPLQHTNFLEFISLKKSLWFWIVIAIAAFSFVSILIFPETGDMLSYIRYIFAFILASFLPGYCLTETLFPKQQTLDTIERFTFSLGLSFALTALVGLFLSFTPFGLTLSTVLLSMGSLVIILAVLALIRKFTKK